MQPSWTIHSQFCRDCAKRAVAVATKSWPAAVCDVIMDTAGSALSSAPGRPGSNETRWWKSAMEQRATIARNLIISREIPFGPPNAFRKAREEERSMKTKLLALLFLVGSAAFAGPRVAVGIGVGGVGVGVGVGVAPAYGYYAPPAPAAAYVAPGPYVGF